MAIGMDSFRQVTGGRMEREIKLGDGNGGEGVRQSGLSRLSARFMGWIKGSSEAQQQQKTLDRVSVKENFVALLEKTEGKEGASRALGACGLPKGWERDDRPLTNRMVEKILDKAQEFRLGVVVSNDKLLKVELRGLEGPENRDLRNAIIRTVQHDSRYGSEKLNKSDMQALRVQAETQLGELRKAQCEERFPGLSGLVKGARDGDPMGGVALTPTGIVGGLREIFRGKGDEFPLVEDSLNQLDQTTELLGRQAWNLDSLSGLAGELTAHSDDTRVLLTHVQDELAQKTLELDGLHEQRRGISDQLDQAKLVPDNQDAIAGLERQLQTMDTLIESKQDQVAIYDALGKELDHQVELLDAKREYVDEMRLTDPLTDRSVKHSNLVWANAGQQLLDRLTDGVNRGEPPLTDDQKDALEMVQFEWNELQANRGQEYHESSQIENVDNLQRIDAPNTSFLADKRGLNDNHPIVAGKRETVQMLRQKLEDVGIPKKTLDNLFSKSSLAQSEREALGAINTWQPINRNMVVMRDGVMRTYRSEVTPAQFINPRLGVDLGNGRVGGISAGVKDSVDHARNLKVSRLVDPGGKTMTTVVGHGVLDMWGVKDKQQRQQANREGAKEVLEVALSSNTRIRESLLDPQRAPDAKPPRLVHVSVNLISPDSVRSFIGSKDYSEKTYTFNQFDAFESNAGVGKDLRVFDPNHPNEDHNAQVDVDAITFSFGINGIATGGAQHILFGTWSNVHEHNTRNMTKLVGDLGDLREGNFGARGTRPGGFIGETYDRLEAFHNDPLTSPAQKQEAARLMTQLRGQTDQVRIMFTSEDFRTGNGDTAKMGREILVLQGLAEQGLDLVGATDLAGTMSKGCKSDKDRGGVTDVELKSKLILRDLGGDMNPDENLQGDDQGVYYTVSSSSGQLENQRWNTGMSGSKEAGHLKARLPDPEVRQFLCGLGKFAKA